MGMVFQVYIKGTIEAVNFYKRAFAAELGRTGKNEDGTYMHAEIVKDGKCIMYLSEKLDSIIGDSMQFCLTFDDDKSAVEVAYNVLSKNCREIGTPLGNFPWGSYGASLIDKFGVQWYIADK